MESYNEHYWSPSNDDKKLFCISASYEQACRQKRIEVLLSGNLPPRSPPPLSPPPPPPLSPPPLSP